MIFKVFLAFETRLELFTSLCARLLVEQDGFEERFALDGFVLRIFLSAGEEKKSVFFWQIGEDSF